jgi:large subunit ribosomal protein L25
MTDKVVLKADIRKDSGSKHAAKVRKQGKCPAIVYGHGEEPVSIALNLHDFTEALHHGHRLLEMDMGGKTENLLVKAIQYDHFGKDIIHADFMRVDLAEVVHVTIDVTFKGEAPGTHEGGMVDVHLDRLEIECKVSEIPDSVECSIREVNVGDSLYASEIELPAGIKLVTDPKALILTCHLVAEAKSTEEVEEEMPAGPEVITEKAPEEEGQEGQKG